MILRLHRLRRAHRRPRPEPQIATPLFARNAPRLGRLGVRKRRKPVLPRAAMCANTSPLADYGPVSEPMKRILLLSTLLTVTACAITQPVTVIDQKSHIMRGTATAALSGGTFQVTDGKVTCAGSYDSLDLSTTITMPVHCSDGRKGIVTATRDNSGQSGSGRIRMSDGKEADFIFGPAAASS